MQDKQIIAKCACVVVFVEAPLLVSVAVSCGSGVEIVVDVIVVVLTGS
jgi:hypothetical protein